MDVHFSAIFLAGLIVGSFLERWTTLILLSTWLTVRNNPMPNYLGGAKPQDMIAYVMSFITVKLLYYHSAWRPAPNILPAADPVDGRIVEVVEDKPKPIGVLTIKALPPISGNVATIVKKY